MTSLITDASTCDIRRPQTALAEQERSALRHPISRWYLCPSATIVSRRLAPTRLRPVHVTALGFISGACAAAILVLFPDAAPFAAVPVLAAWFLDRVDGQLARFQGTSSAWGAWLDANVDELLDVVWHVALAAAAAAQTATSWPWMFLIGFLAGKYLLVHGLMTERQSSGEETVAMSSSGGRWLQRLYHLPGNADVRLHLLVAALVTGWFSLELALICVYYNVRWIVRYVLVARRTGATT